ncbi:hypothetical protein ACLK1W_15455 [Escherichia coli]
MESGTITTIHAAMNDQPVIDAYHNDLRRTRAAGINHSGGYQISGGYNTNPPALYRFKFEAIAVPVPTINVTAMDLSVTVKKCRNGVRRQSFTSTASTDALRGIVDYTELPLVSIDFNHEAHCHRRWYSNPGERAHLIKTLIWCDNEWGFANRMLDTTRAMAADASINDTRIENINDFNPNNKRTHHVCNQNDRPRPGR